MLAALWGVMFLNLGFPAYGPAVINAAMAKSLGLHREMLGNMFSVYMIMSGLPGPLVAVSVNRFGVRKTPGARDGGCWQRCPVSPPALRWFSSVSGRRMWVKRRTASVPRRSTAGRGRIPVHRS